MYVCICVHTVHVYMPVERSTFPLGSMAHLFFDAESLIGLGLTWLHWTDYLRNPPIPAQLTLEI